MRYENARDVLSEALFREVQKCAAGKLLYIPVPPETRKDWGEVTGSRAVIAERNREIRRRYREGESPESLGEIYHLTPYTIRGIVYARKNKKTVGLQEEYGMELQEVFALYHDGVPDTCTLAYEDENEASWGDIYYVHDYRVTWGDTELLVRIEQYCFATEARVCQMDRVIDLYHAMGYDCTRIVKNRHGELCRTVMYNGHPCVVWAEESDARAVTFEMYKDNRTADGRYVCHDEILTACARAAALHTTGEEKTYTILFDPLSAAESGYGDFIDEYVRFDLQNQIHAACPSLVGMYDTLLARYMENRESLRALWGSLPTSLFNGDESDPYFLTPDGHLAGYHCFLEGGLDVCVSQFFDRILSLDEALPADYVTKLPADTGLQKQFADGILRDLAVIGETYTFTETEVRAMPYLYRMYLFGVTFHYGAAWETFADPERAEPLLTYLLRKLTENTIDFTGCMKTQDK